MARLVLVALALSFPTCAGWAQTPTPSASPWQVGAEPRPARSFDLTSTHINQPSGDDSEDGVVAGTELVPDGVVGFGMFGAETEELTHSRATVRDFTVPRQRKPAVGFSLKF